MSSASSLKTQENSNLVPPCWSGEGAGEEGVEEGIAGEQAESHGGGALQGRK